MTNDNTFEDLIHNFLNFLEEFEYELLVSDHIWSVIFSEKRKWYHLCITKYREKYFINQINSNNCSLEISPDEVKEAEFFGMNCIGKGNPASIWKPIIITALDWLKIVKNNWIRANEIIHKGYPFKYRFGIIPNSIVRCALPTTLFRVDEDLGKEKCQKFINLVEGGHFFNDQHELIKSLTANKYFEYCKIAYIAAQREGEIVDANLSGRKLYEQFADGRHEGLLNIDGDSEEEFESWIDYKHPERIHGGHPWEIKRGGNTTHINLSVMKKSQVKGAPYVVQIRGEAINRLEEAIRMFLALYEASYPISIVNPDKIRMRLLGQDNIGIIPLHIVSHRANQLFNEKDDVFDVIYYEEIKKLGISSFITWRPLPILKPRNERNWFAKKTIDPELHEAKGEK
jgi:hypothetical protein